MANEAVSLKSCYKVKTFGNLEYGYVVQKKDNLTKITLLFHVKLV